MDTDTLAAASILQNVTVSVADEGGTVTGAVSGMYDDVSGIVAPCDISEAGAEEDRSQPPDDSRRAPLSEMVNGQNPRRATRSSEVPTCPGEVPVAASEQPDKQVEPPTVEMLKGWAAGARQTHRLGPFDEPKQVRACSNRHASAPRQLSSIVTCAALLVSAAPMPWEQLRAVFASGGGPSTSPAHRAVAAATSTASQWVRGGPHGSNSGFFRPIQPFGCC